MLGKLVSFIIKTIVFFVFLGWVVSYLLIGDMSLAPSQSENVSSDVNSASGLIVPNNDPRFGGNK
ncbi:hypothetical protein [Ferirhizobium litorale]|uniref:Uncharacterized protein n=1 Tax=Ferirhizobium litorale TaxID=2927786 RepID=A0AAE3QC96_9HYPH|nr:hypothetical protein [Fererhizobium litorale]MDI7920706.1 hypothetical protein [Fererhizobium litorale]